MTEHETCKGCKWNHYPLCHGTINDNGDYINIENQKPSFICGKKDDLEVTDFSIKKKTDLEFKINELENRIITLEEK